MLDVAMMGETEGKVGGDEALLHEWIGASEEPFRLVEALLVTHVQGDPAHGPPRRRRIASALFLDLESTPEGLLGARAGGLVVAERAQALEDSVRANLFHRRELAARVDHGLGAANGARETAGRLSGIGGGALALEHLDAGLEHRQVRGEGFESAAAAADDGAHYDGAEVTVLTSALAQPRWGSHDPEGGRLHVAARANTRRVALLPVAIGEHLLDRVALTDAEAADLPTRQGPALAEEAVARVTAEVRAALHQAELASLARLVLAHGELVTDGHERIGRPRRAARGEPAAEEESADGNRTMQAPRDHGLQAYLRRPRLYHCRSRPCDGPALSSSIAPEPHHGPSHTCRRIRATAGGRPVPRGSALSLQRREDRLRRRALAGLLRSGRGRGNRRRPPRLRSEERLQGSNALGARGSTPPRIRHAPPRGRGDGSEGSWLHPAHARHLRLPGPFFYQKHGYEVIDAIEDA